VFVEPRPEVIGDLPDVAGRLQHTYGMSGEGGWEDRHHIANIHGNVVVLDDPEIIWRPVVDRGVSVPLYGMEVSGVELPVLFLSKLRLNSHSAVSPLERRPPLCCSHPSPPRSAAPADSVSRFPSDRFTAAIAHAVLVETLHIELALNWPTRWVAVVASPANSFLSAKLNDANAHIVLAKDPAN